MPVRPLSVELAEKARVELGEDPKKLEDGIQHLKEWIAKQPHLRARTDDQWLATFLRGCKFSMERAKQKIDLYYALKSIASDLNPIKPKDPKFIEILKLGVVVILPKTLNSGDPRVIILKGDFDPFKYSPIEVMSVVHYLEKILYMEDDNFVVSGVINVIDFAGTSLSTFKHVTPVILKKMVIAGQEAVPVRMKGGHYLNTTTAFEAIFNILKSFLNEKNKSRLHMHNKDLESLYKHVSKDILPAEYGGNGGTIAEITDYWVKKVQDYSTWLEEEEEFGTDEARRPGKPKTAEMFGVDGSFRKLNFD